MAAFANVTLVVDQSDLTPYLGENIDATYDAVMQDDVGMDTEAFLTAISRYDWVTNFASLTAKTKRVLSEYVCRAMALAGIAYNMSGFTSRVEAEDMINVHIFRMGILEKMLSDQNVVTFMKA